MPDDEVHLHPSRPPTEAEHRFARAITGALRFLGHSLCVVLALLVCPVAFVRGTMVLLSGRAGEATLLDGMCVSFAVLVMFLVALSTLVYAVEWVRWASRTKPARREHDEDWRADP